MKLRDLLTAAARAETVDASKEYRLLGIRLDGQGPFLRESVMGTQTSATRLYLVAKGDFIYSRLFACRGAFGVISAELDGCYVSGEFPTFTPVENAVDVEFLKYWFRLPSVIATVDADCSGSTPLTRNRFKENFFLALEIPLPSLSEQRRVVGRIEELADQINEASTLRHRAAEEAEALSLTLSAERFRKWNNTVPLRDLIADGTTISYGVLVPGPEVEEGIPFIRIQDLAVKNAPDRPSKRISVEIEKAYGRTRLKGGEVLVAVVGATIGKVGVAPDSWRGANIARAVCRIVPGPRIDRDFLVRVLQSKDVQDYFHGATRTLAQPTLNVGQLEQTQIPVPPLAEQRRIVAELDALQSQVDALKRLQSETAAELDALLPSILDKAFKGEF